jgi:hypothetical protein
MSLDVGRRFGKALGEECRARGVHCLLGPTTNIQRHPCGGRGFESYSEGEDGVPTRRRNSTSKDAPSPVAHGKQDAAAPFVHAVPLTPFWGQSRETTITIIDPAYVLGQMSIEEKIALLSGDDMWHTVPIPRLGVPRVRCSDGPVSLIVVSLD